MNAEYHEGIRYAYPLTPHSIVIDAGGYEGNFAAQIIEQYQCTVHVLEPVPEFYGKIVQRIGRRAHVHNFGIGRWTQTIRFRVHGDMSSCLRSTEADVIGVLRSAGEILRILGIEQVALLKLNIEGSEFAVLESILQEGLVQRFENIQVQWHDVVEDAATRRDAIIARMGLSHDLAWDFGWVWQSYKLKANP